MIVVVGSPVHRAEIAGGASAVAGPGPAIARGAVAAGGMVQLVGKVGSDALGDATLLALARDGVGHSAMLRDASHPTPIGPADDPDEDPFTVDRPGATVGPIMRPLALDAEDLELALRYLGAFAVLVATDGMDPRSLMVAADAAQFAGASLVVIVSEGVPTSDLPPDAIVLVAPASDENDIFANMVGTCAAALDRGLTPADALRTALAAGGWEPAQA